MKRRFAAISLFLTILFHAHVSQATDAKMQIPECGLLRIFIEVWKNHPLGESEGGAWILHSEGEYSRIDWAFTPQRNKIQWSAPIPQNLSAQVHTHGEHLDPRPSDQDRNVARQLKIPVYVLTRRSIWEAFPDGDPILVAQGDWFNVAKGRCKDAPQIVKLR